MRVIRSGEVRLFRLPSRSPIVMAPDEEDEMALDPRRDASGPQIAPYSKRALALWPRLDPVRLRRAKEDPHRIARLVEGRTAISSESILELLGVRRRVGDGDA